MFGCIIVVLIFQNATNMEAAYGLAIIVDMLMTTLLLGFFYRVKLHSFFWPLLLTILLFLIEFTFFIANLEKFPHGGWFSFLIAVIGGIMVFILFRAQKIRDKHTKFVELKDYINLLKNLQNNVNISK